MASAVVLASHGLIAIQDLKPAYEYEPVNSLKIRGLARPSWHSTYLTPPTHKYSRQGYKQNNVKTHSCVRSAMPSLRLVTMNASATVRSARYCENVRSWVCRKTTGWYVSVEKRELMRDTRSATPPCSSFSSVVERATWIRTTCLKMSVRQRNDNQTDFAVKLRETAQESLKREELVPHALHLVQFIPPNNDFHVHIALLKQLHPFGHLGVFTFNIQAAHVDAHWEHGDVDKLAFPGRNTLRHSLKAQDAAHSLAEMTGEVGSLEPDEVRGEQAMEAISGA
jgi:hypothetical protein